MKRLDPPVLGIINKQIVQDKVLVQTQVAPADWLKNLEKDEESAKITRQPNKKSEQECAENSQHE